MIVQEKEQGSSILRFTSVRFHYIYCFLLDTKDMQTSELLHRLLERGWNRGIPWSRKGWLPTHTTTTVVNNQAYKYMGVKAPEDAFFSVEQALERSPRMRVLTSIGSPVGGSGKQECRISRLLRCRSNGSGSLTITIDVRNALGDSMVLSDLEAYMRLVPRTWVQREFNVATSDQIREEGADFLTAISPVEAAGNEEQRSISLDDLFCDSLAEFDSLGMRLAFPEITYETGGVKLSEALRGRQIPYLFVDVETTQQAYVYYFRETSENYGNISRRRVELAKQTAALLMHFFNLDKYDAISLDYIKSEFSLLGDSHPIFSSMNANSEVFTYVHKTAALSFCGDRSQGASTFVLPSMMDIVEACRVRWHTLMIASLALDYLLSEVPTASPEKVDELIYRLESFRKVIGLQMWDPHLYLHDGHVGFDIGGVLQRSFRFEAMQEALTQKLGLLDTLLRRHDFIQAIASKPSSQGGDDSAGLPSDLFDPLAPVHEEF